MSPNPLQGIGGHAFSPRVGRRLRPFQAFK
jgi:hypothetical protein